MKIFKVQPKTCYIPNKAEHAVTEEDGEIGLQKFDFEEEVIVEQIDLKYLTSAQISEKLVEYGVVQVGAGEQTK